MDMTRNDLRVFDILWVPHKNNSFFFMSAFYVRFVRQINSFQTNYLINRLIRNLLNFLFTNKSVSFQNIFPLLAILKPHFSLILLTFSLIFVVLAQLYNFWQFLAVLGSCRLDLIFFIFYFWRFLCWFIGRRKKWSIFLIFFYLNEFFVFSNIWIIFIRVIIKFIFNL